MPFSLSREGGFELRNHTKDGHAAHCQSVDSLGAFGFDKGDVIDSAFVICQFSFGVGGTVRFLRSSRP